MARGYITVQRRYFYQNNQLKLTQPGNQASCIMRAGKLSIVEQRKAMRSGTTEFLITDLAGSVIRTYGVGADTVLNYNPYGFFSPRERDAPTLTFSGERLDTLTEQYVLGNGNRMYSATSMRFYSPDPLSPFLRGGLNSYCYCSNDPINYHDPTGRERTRLQRIASHQIARYSGDPIHKQTSALRKRVENHDLQSKNANALAMDARQAAERHVRRADSFQRVAGWTKNEALRKRYLLVSADEDNIASTHFDNVIEHTNVRAQEMESSNQLMKEILELPTTQEENYPDLARVAPNVQVNRGLPVHTQNARIRQPHGTRRRINQPYRPR